MSETTTASTDTDARTAQALMFAALAKAGAAADGVHKGARNEFHRYRYASAESIYEEARGALHGQGLAIVPISEALVSSPDGEAQRHRVDLVYMLTHQAGGSLTLCRSWPVVPDKGRPLDKALAAALTTALSYLCRDLLLLPRVDEEVDKREEGAPKHNDGGPVVVMRSVPKRLPQREQPENAARVNDDTPAGDQPSGPPPGAEEEDLADQLWVLLPRLPEDKRKLYQAAFNAARASKNIERMRAGVEKAKAEAAPKATA